MRWIREINSTLKQADDKLTKVYSSNIRGTCGKGQTLNPTCRSRYIYYTYIWMQIYAASNILVNAKLLHKAICQSQFFSKSVFTWGQPNFHKLTSFTDNFHVQIYGDKCMGNLKTQ